MNKTCYFIQETVRDNDNGYIPCIAVEGETGYHKTDWNWGPNKVKAQSIANAKNALLGISKKEACLIVLQSM